MYLYITDTPRTLDSANDRKQNEVAFVVVNIDMPSFEPVLTEREQWGRLEWYRMTDLLTYIFERRAFLP